MDINIWQELGIEPTQDKKTIKRAYSQRLKQVHPEDDPDGFQRLRFAYEQALEQQQYFTKPIPERPMSPRLEKQKPASFRFVRVSRQECYQQLADYVSILLNVLQTKGEQIAIATLKQWLQQPILLHIESREQFEDILLPKLIQLPQLPYQLLLFLDRLGHWRKESLEFSRRFEFGEDLLDKIRAYLIYYSLARLASVSLKQKNKVEKRKILAARLLVSQYRPVYFRWKKLLRSDLLDVIKQLLAEIDSEVVVSEYFNQATLNWWREAIKPSSITWSVIQGLVLLLWIRLAVDISVELNHNHFWPVFLLLMIAYIPIAWGLIKLKQAINHYLLPKFRILRLWLRYGSPLVWHSVFWTGFLLGLFVFNASIDLIFLSGFLAMWLLYGAWDAIILGFIIAIIAPAVNLFSIPYFWIANDVLLLLSGFFIIQLYLLVWLKRD